MSFEIVPLRLCVRWNWEFDETYNYFNNVPLLHIKNWSLSWHQEGIEMIKE